MPFIWIEPVTWPCPSFHDCPNLLAIFESVLEETVSMTRFFFFLFFFLKRRFCAIIWESQDSRDFYDFCPPHPPWKHRQVGTVLYIHLRNPTLILLETVMEMQLVTEGPTPAEFGHMSQFSSTCFCFHFALFPLCFPLQTEIPFKIKH